jgi:hypothetical protein
MLSSVAPTNAGAPAENAAAATPASRAAVKARPHPTAPAGETDAAPAAQAPPEAPQPPAPEERMGTLLLRLAASAPELLVDDLLTVEVLATADAGVVDAPFHLVFDPNVLRFADAAQGEFLTRDGGGVVFMANGTARPGDVAVGIGRTDRSAGIAGSGVLTRVRLRAVATGVTALRLERTLAWDARGNRLQVGVEGAGVAVR